MTGNPRHFVDLSALPGAELRGIIDHSRAMKADRNGSGGLLAGRMLAMIFDKQQAHGSESESKAG